MKRLQQYKINEFLNIPSKKIFTNFGTVDQDVVECHVYSDDNLLASNHNIDNWKMDQFDKDGEAKEEPRIQLDIHKHVRSLGFAEGKFLVKYNFYRNILGSYEKNDGLYIAEISATRLEVRLETTSGDKNILELIDSLVVKDTSKFVDGHWQDLQLNLGDDETILVVNWGVGKGGSVIFKLYEPLPKEILIKQQLWINKTVVTSHTEEIRLIKPKPIPLGFPIQKPDWDIKINKITAGDSDYETWDSILGDNLSSADLLLNKVLKKDGTATELNIDYSDYSNFVHFSSANERLENFKYKKQLIEHYELKITTISSNATTGSVVITDTVKYNAKLNELIISFDGYEKYLYNASASSAWPKTNAVYPYTLDTVANSAAWFTSQALLAAKYDLDNGNNLKKTVPGHIVNDPNNENYLLFVDMAGQHFDKVWSYIKHSSNIYSRDNSLYEGLSKDLIHSTLASLGWQSFQGFQASDIWEYMLGTNASGSYGSATASIANPTGGTSSGSIEYVYATPQQQQYPITTEDIVTENWKRILNNLPYLLKTKGTDRNIKALLSTYGLPSTLLRVFEYGGPEKDKTKTSFNSFDKFAHALQFDNDAYVRIPFDLVKTSHPLVSLQHAPDMVECRFNTVNKINSQSLMSKKDSKWSVEIAPHPSASNLDSGYYNHGTVNFWIKDNPGGGGNTIAIWTGSTYLPLYDSDWWNISITRDIPQKTFMASQATYRDVKGLTINIAKSADHSKGRITHTSSLNVPIRTWTKNWENSLNKEIFLGGKTGSGLHQGNRFTGSIQEFRTWVFPESTAIHTKWLDNEYFHNHVKNPLSIESFDATGSYEQLYSRYSFGADMNKFSGSWIPSNTFKPIMSSSHPSVYTTANHTLTPIANLDATPDNFAMDGTDWTNEDEKYFVAMPGAIGSREIADKIRIEPAVTPSILSPTSKIFRKDTAILDLNKVGVYFAPHFEIDIDIASDLGGNAIDDYMGNPLDIGKRSYAGLRALRQHYWKKHSGPYSFFDYMNVLKQLDHTMFKQIETMLPARANAQVGLLIKGNMLDRPKIPSLRIINVDRSDQNSPRQSTDVFGFLSLRRVHLKSALTTVGGDFFKPIKDGKIDYNLAPGMEGSGPQQVHMNYLTGNTDQAVGFLNIPLDTRKSYGGYDFGNKGSRYKWKIITFTPSGSGVVRTDSYIQQGGASYENNEAFLVNVQSAGYIGNPGSQHLGNPPSSSIDLSARSGSTLTRPSGEIVPSFNDFGNIPYYHHTKVSRKYSTYAYHYLSDQQNVPNGNVTSFTASLGDNNGWPTGSILYKSTLGPVRKTKVPAQTRDDRSIGSENRAYRGCKLIGSDFNMPLTATADGGPVVEFNEVAPVNLIVGGNGFTATGGTM